MMHEVSGFTVTRTIPDKVLFEVLTGAYEVCGGVVRNNAGQIVAHLVNAVNPLNSVQPSNAVLDAINTYQLSRIGRDVTKIGAGLSDHLITLSNGTMLFSGLTLAVSTAGFAFLIMKQQETDQKLQELQKDVKEIKDFLNMKQRAELKNALKNLQDVSDAPTDETRRHLLVDTRQTLGVLRHHYQMQFEEAGFQGKVSASEEYFTISAIAHALCTGELDMHETAALSLQESYTRWSEMCRKVAKEKLLRSDPQRFLSRRYASRVRTDELIDWMEFAHADEKGIGWVDELRAKPTKGFWLYEDTVLTPSEILEIELFKRLSSRNRIYQGYCSQYQYFRQQKLRPSAFQDQIDKLDRSQMVGDTYILVANEMAGSMRVA